MEMHLRNIFTHGQIFLSKTLYGREIIHIFVHYGKEKEKQAGRTAKPLARAVHPRENEKREVRNMLYDHQ